MQGLVRRGQIFCLPGRIPGARLVTTLGGVLYLAMTRDGTTPPVPAGAGYHVLILSESDGFETVVAEATTTEECRFYFPTLPAGGYHFCVMSDDGMLVEGVYQVPTGEIDRQRPILIMPARDGGSESPPEMSEPEVSSVEAANLLSCAWGTDSAAGVELPIPLDAFQSEESSVSRRDEIFTLLGQAVPEHETAEFTCFGGIDRIYFGFVGPERATALPELKLDAVRFTCLLLVTFHLRSRSHL